MTEKRSGSMTDHSRRPAAVAGFLALAALPLLAACGADSGADEGAAATGDAEAGADAPSHTFRPAAPEVGERVTRTDGGREVAFTIHPDPPRAGELDVEFRFDDAPSDPSSVIVDVLSPEMAAHGIVRFPVEAAEDGRFTSRIEIPMEGVWEVWIELGREQETASFRFRVDPGEDGPVHAGHEGHEHGEHDHGDHDHGDHDHGDHDHGDHDHGDHDHGENGHHQDGDHGHDERGDHEHPVNR